MEKTTIYAPLYNDNGKVTIQEIESYVFINPLTNKKTWLIKDEEYARSYYYEEFEEQEYFLTKEEAQNYIDNNIINNTDFINKCIDFHNMCKKYNERNPFIDIGSYYIKSENNKAIDEISDSIYKYYFSRKLSTSEYLSESATKILSIIDK